MRCLVTEYKFRIGQLVYFHPKGIGRSHVDGGPGPYQIVGDYLSLMMVTFSTRLGVQSRTTIGWQERAS